jgi:lysophospholipase L1-like esterase
MNVLLLGDSHTVGPYGNALTTLFTNTGANVTRLANVGATGSNYLLGKYQKDYAAVAAQPFDVAIITLGTNDAAASDSTPPAKSAETFKKLANGLNARQVWYVGPPSFSDNAARTYNKVFAGPGKDLNTRADAVFKAAQALFGERAIDPRAVTAPFVQQNDIHLGKEGGEAWAAAVFAKVNAPTGISLTTVVAAIGAVLIARKLLRL